MMNKEEEAAKMAAIKKILFMRLLDNKARERLNNIRLANPAFAEQLESVLLVYAQKSGGKKIDEQTLIRIARSARGEKPKGSIRRL